MSESTARIPEPSGHSELPPTTSPEAHSEPARPRRTRRILAAVATVVVLGLVIAFVAMRDTSTRLEKAAAVCKLSGIIDDEGRTLSMDRVAAEEDPGRIKYTDYECVLDQLSVPRAVRDHMGATRAMDGMQTDAWDGISARWNYHPKSGIDITLTEE
jgi:hypothetical protein